jgi:acyl-coenzyme A synthetase/AMP-(fatty) acid ligase
MKYREGSDHSLIATARVKQTTEMLYIAFHSVGSVLSYALEHCHLCFYEDPFYTGDRYVEVMKEKKIKNFENFSYEKLGVLCYSSYESPCI